MTKNNNFTFCMLVHVVVVSLSVIDIWQFFVAYFCFIRYAMFESILSFFLSSILVLVQFFVVVVVNMTGMTISLTAAYDNLSHSLRKKKRCNSSFLFRLQLKPFFFFFHFISRIKLDLDLIWLSHQSNRWKSFFVFYFFFWP